MPDLFREAVNIKWKEVAPSPVATALHTAVLYNNAVYVGGGRTDSDDRHSGNFHVNVYHLDINKWDNPISTPHELFAMVVLMNKLLILGGITKISKLTTKSVLALDGYQWKGYTEMPTARHSASAVNYQMMIIVMGGVDKNRLLNKIEIFDGTTGQWFKCNNLLQPLLRPESVVLGDTLYVLSGQTQGEPSTEVYAASLDTLPSHQLKWQRLADIPWTLSAAAGLNNKYLLAVGGLAASDTICVLSTTNKGGMSSGTSSWKSIGCLPIVQAGPAAVCYGNQVVVVGGIDKNGKKSNAVYIGTF